MANKSSTSGGTSILTVLLVVFIVLKLVHVINWSWWLVTAPFWAPLLLVLAIFGIIGFVLLSRSLLK